MTSGFAVGDIIAISSLAINVHTAYQDAGDDCKHIFKEVATLQILIEQVAQHFKSPNISSHDCHYGLRFLKQCQSVLDDLNSLIQKYKRLASTNKSLVLTRVKVGKEDMVALWERLISSTGLLNGFVQRFIVPSFHFMNPVDINMVIVVDIGRSRHGWLLFLTCTTQVQAFR